MGIAVDNYLGEMPGPEYKCFDFVRKVWRESFGTDVGDQLASLAVELKQRTVTRAELKTVKRIAAPVDPCFIVFFRPRTEPHIGIYHDGSVLSLNGWGSTFETVKNAARRYGRVSYYLP